jgi:hypothetical protein
MLAWAQTSSAWVDGPGAWQPAGVDHEVAASGLSLTLVAPAVAVPEWTGVDAGPAALVLAGPGVALSVGMAVPAGVGTLGFAAHSAVFQDAAWREFQAGRGIAAISWRAASRPATGAALASSLGRPKRTA